MVGLFRISKRRIIGLRSCDNERTETKVQKERTGRVGGPSRLSIEMVCIDGPSSWSVKLVCQAGPSSWSFKLLLEADPFSWFF